MSRSEFCRFVGLCVGWTWPAQHCWHRLVVEGPWQILGIVELTLFLHLSYHRVLRLWLYANSVWSEGSRMWVHMRLLCVQNLIINRDWFSVSCTKCIFRSGYNYAWVLLSAKNIISLELRLYLFMNNDVESVITLDWVACVVCDRNVVMLMKVLTIIVITKFSAWIFDYTWLIEDCLV